jgi:CubicO group peptidase (beta-lactamase class C family)
VTPSRTDHTQNRYLLNVVYRYILERPVLEPPGARWTYCGGATALLGRLIADGTGMPLPQ